MSNLTVVLTSCRRHDLLVRTLESFFATNRYPIHEFIIIEDSDQDQVRDLAERFPEQPIRFIVNGQNLGQHRSIDKAYAQVKTPYVLHLEDDWQFPVPGTVEKGMAIIESCPDIFMVLLRKDADMPRSFKKLPRIEQPAPYRRVDAGAHRTWYSFTFNPTIKRLADYQRLPQGYSGFQGEVALSLYYKDQGAVLAWLEGTGVDHLGFDHSNFARKRKRGLAGVLESARRFFSMATLRKWKTSLGRRIEHQKRKRKLGK
ncbi:glycosyltransferase [Rhizobium helianthi]|uniref:Glycosyltransferase n=1 Tax=Rhizobium helianthi TaxID=1132695 RepID=A0ABW4M3L4_9HYPH